MPRIPRIDRLPATGRRQALSWLVLPAVSGLLAACDRLHGGSTTPAFKGIDITGAPYGRGFTLTDFNGRGCTLAEFRGKVVMLYFGFVQCPDV